MAAIGHGGLKEGQVVNRLFEEYEKEHKKEITDETILERISEANSQKVHIAKSKSGIVVKGINDMAVRFSKCCNPVPGDEIVGFVTRGRGMSIHRTDCINMLHLSDVERARLIDAEWEDTSETEGGGKYLAELKTRIPYGYLKSIYRSENRCEVYECSHKQKGNSNDRYGIYCKRKRGTPCDHRETASASGSS